MQQCPDMMHYWCCTYPKCNMRTVVHHDGDLHKPGALQDHKHGSGEGQDGVVWEGALCQDGRCAADNGVDQQLVDDDL